MSDDRDDYTSKSLDRLEKSVDKVDEKCDNVDKTMAAMLARFQAHLETDEKMYEEFKDMNNILKVNTELLKVNTDSLKHHILRTDTLQDMVAHTNNRLDPIEREYLKKHAVNEFFKTKAMKWGKIFVIAGTIATIAQVIAKLVFKIGL